MRYGETFFYPTKRYLRITRPCKIPFQAYQHDYQCNFKTKSTKISRAGSYFKPILVQVANALIKSKKHPEFTDRYRRIKARRGHKKAIIAICRMLLTAIWHIFTDLKPYTPDGFLESHPVNESKILTTSQVLNILKLRGYTIKDDVVPAT